MLVEIEANPDCAHCRHAVDVVTTMAIARGLPVAGVDLRQHPELARGHERSPLVRVGGRIFEGVPTPDEFAALVAGGPSQGI